MLADLRLVSRLPEATPLPNLWLALAQFGDPKQRRRPSGDQSLAVLSSGDAMSHFTLPVQLHLVRVEQPDRQETTNRSSRKGAASEDPDPIWLSYSTGRWDQDTFVVDTVGLTDQTWLDSVGHPHSDKLHVVERIRRVGADSMEIDFTFDDPETYTKPWTGKMGYQRIAGWQIIEHFACENKDLYGDALLKGKP